METRNEKTRAKTSAVRAWLVALLPALVAPAEGLQVEGFTSAAVQEAVSRASAGDTLSVFRGRVPIHRDGRHRQEHHPARRGRTRGRGRGRAGRTE